MKPKKRSKNVTLSKLTPVKIASTRSGGLAALLAAIGQFMRGIASLIEPISKLLL